MATRSTGTTDSAGPAGPARAQVDQEPGAADPAAQQADGTDGEPDRAGDPESQADLVVRDAISAPDVDGVPRRATRRFPLFTRDTARPEGGGRAVTGDVPPPVRQWPMLVAAGMVAVGLLVIALDRVRPGALIIGAALLVSAALRRLLPDVGLLAVRSRFTDVATYAVMGLAITLLALMMQPDPVLKLAFLRDFLHFTVAD